MAQLFNACEYLLDRRIAAGDGQRVALTGPAGDVSYAELYDRVCRTAAGLRGEAAEHPAKSPASRRPQKAGQSVT